MKTLPYPLNDKKRLIKLLAMYENKPQKLQSTDSIKSYKRNKRNHEKEVEKLPLFNKTNSEIKPEFLSEFRKFKELIKEGLSVERAICLVRNQKEHLIFDELTLDSQELFIGFMEKEWEEKK